MTAEINTDDARGLLARGLDVPATDELPAELPYLALRDPDGAERLGSALAEQCRSYAPTGLLTWEEPHDLVLAHIVARTLGIGAVRAYNQDGLVAFQGTFAPTGRVLLVADTYRSAESVRALCSLAGQQGQQVVGAAALRDIGGPGHAELDQQDVPLVAVLATDTTDHADG